MSAQFLPEYSFVPVPGGYKPAYRLFVDKPLHIVPGSVAVASTVQATALAKEYVRERLNPPIRSEVMVDIQDELGVDQWRREKAQQAIEEQQSVLGAIIIKGRQIEVETKRRRA